MSQMDPVHSSGAASDLSPDEQRLAGAYARSEDGKRLGASVAMGMLGEMAVRGQTPATQEAARALMAEGGAPVEALPPAVADPQTGAAGGLGLGFLAPPAPAEPAPAAVPVPAQPFPDAPAPFLSAPTPPWDDDEDDDVPAAAAAAAEAEDDDGWVDPDRLRAELAKERKRREHAEKQAAQAKVGVWIEEAVKHFGTYISNEELAGIEATSRRAFLREAESIARRNHAVLARFGVSAPAQQPAAAATGETEEQLRARIRAEEQERARAEAADAWGRPMTSPAAPAPSTEHEVAKERARQSARRTGNMEKMIRANLFGR